MWSNLSFPNLRKDPRRRKWVSYKLKERDIKRLKNPVKFCLPDRKETVFCIELMGVVKWIYYNNSKCKKSRADPGQLSTRMYPKT